VIFEKIGVIQWRDRNESNTPGPSDRTIGDDHAECT
jgi:hypothetical protein